MTIYYDSRTGNVERFIRKLFSRTGWTCVKISEGLIANDMGHLVTYTTKKGCIPLSTELFMETNHHKIRSVSSSGNMNWGIHFAVAADKLSAMYEIPVLLKFELAGLDRDLDAFISGVNARNETCSALLDRSSDNELRASDDCFCENKPTA